MGMPRVLAFSHEDAFLFDLDPRQVIALDAVETINGENSLTLVSTQQLEKGTRLLHQDARGYWHEYVVIGATDSRYGDLVAREHYCVWSLQYDLSGTFVSGMPGTQAPVQARVALETVLSGTDRWTIGTVTNLTTAGASMYRRGGWDAMGVLLKTWGGELQATIEVSLGGVVSRSVDLLTHVGAETATRRFDYGHDVTGITRTVEDGAWPCRIIPLGKGEETDGGGYGRRVTIESVNGGVLWLQDDTVAPLVRVPDGNGGWEYPTQVVVQDSIETPAALKAWATEYIGEHTRPRVTYQVDLAQHAQAGTDPHGVSLGDEVVVVDRTFGTDGLAIEARAVGIRRSLLDPSDATLTVGNARQSLAGQLSSIAATVARLSEQSATTAEYQATAAYLSELLTRLNTEANATGGYTYITEGQGIRTYDTAVSDPLVGAEASAVVEVKGGTIRIANSRTAGGDWEWKSVFTSGHVAAELVTAANLVAGHIGNPTDDFYIDLDNHVLYLPASAAVGDTTLQGIIDAADATISAVDVQYAQNQSSSTPPASGWSTTAPAWQAGYYIWQRTATTTPSGTIYSTPVMISGRDGEDGTSVTILGSYNSYAELIAAHPTGNVGDGYLVAGDLYVWDGTQWTDVGTIQGPPGTNGTNGANGSQIWTATANPTTPDYTFALSALTGPSGVTPQVGDLIVRSYYRYTITSVGSTSVLAGTRTSIRGASGANGRGISSTTISYGASASATTEPTTWQGTVPALSQGQWLWVRTVTTYTDSTTSTSYTKSYVGMDGEDGESVYVQSATKTGRTTTVVIASSDGTTTTLTIDDGTDGINGTPGTNGLNGFVHTAWANSQDGTVDFSTTVSADKSYLGVYTDNVQLDSTNPADYSWSLIKGAKGDDGLGITSITEQYYLSTSDQSPTGGSWQDSQPTWVSGTYIWTRSVITWDDATVTTTTPVLAEALTQANSEAKSASDAASVNTQTLTDLQTQQAIFDLLTDNGTIQGLYMQGGQLYVNTSYILGGILQAGGANNVNGIIRLLDANGNVVGQLDKDGANIVGDVTMRNIHSETSPYGIVSNWVAQSLMGEIATVTPEQFRMLFSSQGLPSSNKTIYGMDVSYFAATSSTANHVYILPAQSSSGGAAISATGNLTLTAGAIESSSDTNLMNVRVQPKSVRIGLGYSGTTPWLEVSKTSSAAQARLVADTLYLGYPAGGFSTNVNMTGSATIGGSLTVSGTKSRIAETTDYGDRLLYCYETPAPMFGDMGSGTIGDDGLCYVEIDDIFGETARTDMAYQVFLQKCGQGDLWVTEKHPNYFVVEGTPGLTFDWELKGHQTGYEYERLDEKGMADAIDDRSDITSPEDAYEEELGYVAALEALYDAA